MNKKKRQVQQQMFYCYLAGIPMGMNVQATARKASRRMMVFCIISKIYKESIIDSYTAEMMRSFYYDSI
jgi:hypothetical protein